ncbi:MAG: hypothetical protein EOP84_06565 [Verrucomicrobiaceae bacterium]|nr:MAG: hypothetical protein EOP84_06565 [Verrucomicrobiaceae bacterium]
MIEIYELEGLSILVSHGGESINGGEPTNRHDYRTEYYVYPGVVQSLESVRRFESVIGYRSADGESLSREEYAAKQVELTANSDYDGNFPTLEEEFAYRKFKEKWEPIKEPTEERTPIQFSITKLAYDAEDLPPYTVPCRLGGATPTSKNYALFKYSPNRLALLKQVAEECGFSYGGEKSKDPMEFGIPEHSIKDFRFVTVGGNYTRNPEGRISVCGMVGTLKECQDRHRANLSSLRRFWQEESAKAVPKPLDAISAGALLSIAQGLLITVKEVDPKRASWNNWKSAVTQAEQMVERVRKVAVEVTP